jgi:hypothetical protein
MEKRLDMGAALFALVAAVFWFLSAYGKLPPMVSYLGESNPPDDPFGGFVSFIQNEISTIPFTTILG